MRLGKQRLRVFVLTTAPAADVAAASGGGVTPLVPENPFALAEAIATDSGAGSVLIAGTETQHHLVRTQATFAAARWPDLQVAWRTPPVAVLAVTNAAGIAARSGLVATLAVGCFDLVLEGTWSGAWVRSVARLHDPAPSLGHHLRSWLPGGGGFLVLHRPDAQVLPLGVIGHGRSPVAASQRGTLLVGGDASPHLTAKVMVMAGAAASRCVPAVADAKFHYGTARAVEFVVSSFVPDDGALRPVGPCPSCRLLLTSPACPFCHASATAADAVRRAG